MTATPRIPLTEQEQLTALVYGDTFALYDEPSFDEFIAPLYTRLQANRIDTGVFMGKRCLDAGCGGGRGSILMAQCGAREVIGVDLSPVNVDTCRKRAAQKGFKNLLFVHHSLMELPFEAESFDIVWCNGVLHHATDPDQGLQEISRVLKIGGHLWLYLYGSGGIYWYMIDWIRRVLQGVNIQDCIGQLRLLEMPVRRIAEWIDDWFCPLLRRYTARDVMERLNELGYDRVSPLSGGTLYDTSQRRVNASDREKALMGTGDLRFFCQKTKPPTGHQFPLPDPPDGTGSPYTDGPEVRQFEPSLAALEAALHRLQSRCGHSIVPYKIMVCRSVHSQVRSLLETDRPFDTTALHAHLVGVQTLLEQLHTT
jgi:ubiquinone/menaquinone biosynthesis C-methylase UbiE